MKLNKLPFLRLYREGLARTRVLAIVCASLTFFACIMAPISSLVSSLVYGSVFGDDFSVETVGVAQLSMPLLLLLCFVPFFVFSAFSFLRRRNACDLYHALPYRRRTVYIAFVCAAMTWVTVIAVGGMTARAVLFAVNPYIQFGFGQLVLGIVVYLIAALFLMGCAALAVTLTGTRASCLFAFFLLLFSFRVVFATYVSTIEALAPILNTEFGFYGMLRFGNLLPLSLVRSLLDTSHSVFTNAPLLLYFALIGLASLALAGLFFVRRKSESAACSVASTAALRVFSFLFSTPVLLLGVSQLVRGELLLAFMCMTVAFGIYFLFELLFPGKSRRMLSALMFAPLMLAFALIFAGVVHLNVQFAIKKEVKAEDIEAISFERIDMLPSYEDYQTSSVLFTDEKMISCIADAYAENIAMIKNGTYERNRFQGPYRSETTDVTVHLKNGSTHRFDLLMAVDAYDDLYEMTLANQAYRDAYLRLPEADELYYVFIAGLPDAGAFEQIWQTFSDEYQTLSVSEKLEAKDGNTNGLFYVSVGGTYKGNDFTSYYYVTPSMPRTLSALQSMFARAKNVAYFESYFDPTVTYGDMDVTYDCTLFWEGEAVTFYCYNGQDYSSEDSKEEQAVAIAMAAYDKEAAFDVQTPFVIVELEVYNTDEYESGTLMFNLSPADAAQIVSLLNAQN